MTRIAVGIVALVVGLAGCERQSTTPSASDKPMRQDKTTKVDVQAPGVDVKVRGQKPEGEGGKADVDVDVKKDKDK